MRNVTPVKAFSFTESCTREEYFSEDSQNQVFSFSLSLSLSLWLVQQQHETGDSCHNTVQLFATLICWQSSTLCRLYCLWLFSNVQYFWYVSSLVTLHNFHGSDLCMVHHVQFWMKVIISCHFIVILYSFPRTVSFTHTDCMHTTHSSQHIAFRPPGDNPISVNKYIK
jgi:hypothetical protein